MNDALFLHRIHFAFTITFHYLFPQLTMGLALLIVVLKALALFKKDELYNNVARFWARIFAINFAVVPDAGALVLGLTIMGVAALIAFVLRQRRAANPLYDLDQRFLYRVLPKQLFYNVLLYAEKPGG